MRITKKIVVIFCSMFLLAGCSFPGLASNKDENTVAITGGITTESQILASLVAGMIEHYTDKDTTLINNLGTTTIIQHAMTNGDADISATRYTGTDIATILLLPPEKDPKKAMQVVQKEFKKRYNQDWLPSYGFDNTYVFLVRKDTAKKYNLKTISDLGKVQDKLKVGVDRTWTTHAGDGYPDFKKEYGFTFDNFYPMEIGLVYDAVAAHRMDVVLGYSTDGRIASYDLVMLKDDKQFFPPYDASAVVSGNLDKQSPAVKKAVARLEGKVDTETMQKLNYQADNNLVEPSIVAQEFLAKHHYFEKE